MRGYHFPIIVGEFEFRRFQFSGLCVGPECKQYTVAYPTCFCFPNRYAVAAIVGILAAWAQYIIASLYMSVSVLADAVHGGSDSVSLALVAALVFTVRVLAPKLGIEIAERIDWLNEKINATFLTVAAIFVVYEVYVRITGVHPVVSPTWVIVGGAIGFVGQWLQHQALGEDVAHGMHKSHESTHKHIHNDKLYSLVVLVGGFAMLFGVTSAIDIVLAVLLAGKMLWDAWGMFHRESHARVAQVIADFRKEIKKSGRNPYDRGG